MRTLSSAALAATVALGSVWVAQLSAQVAPVPLTLTSTAFANGGKIPNEHFAVGGKDKSPRLAWVGALAGTAQFAVIAEDLDAMNPLDPGRPLVTWVVYRIPGTATGLPKGMAPGRVKSGPLIGTMQGLGSLDRLFLESDKGGGVAESITTAEYSRPGSKPGAVGSGGLRDGGGQPSGLYLARPFMNPVRPEVKPRYRYRGPATQPFDRLHHVIFTVYAIDADLALPEGLDKQQLLTAIDGHVTGKGELAGIFRR